MQKLKDEYEQHLEIQKEKHQEELEESYKTEGLGKYKHENKQLTERVENLEEKKTRLDWKMKEWRVAFNRISEEIASLHRKLKEVGREKIILEDRLKGADLEVEVLEKQIEGLRKERGPLPDEVVEGKYERRIARLRKEIAELKKQLHYHVPRSKEKSKFYDRLLARDREATELEMQLDNFKRDIRLNPETMLKSQCEREKTKLQEQIDELEPLKSDVRKLNDESNAQKVELREQKRKIAALNDESWKMENAANERIDTLKAELEAARQDTLAAPETQASRQCEREKAKLRRQIVQLEGDLGVDLEAAKKENNFLANAWKEKNQEFKNQETQLERKIQEIRDQKAELEEQYSLIDSLEAEIKDWEENPERGGNQADPDNQAAIKCEREKAILQRRIDELTKALDKAKKEPDWDVGPDPDFDLPSYTPFSLSKTPPSPPQKRERYTNTPQQKTCNPKYYHSVPRPH